MGADYLAIYRLADGMLAEAWVEWTTCQGWCSLVTSKPTHNVGPESCDADRDGCGAYADGASPVGS